MRPACWSRVMRSAVWWRKPAYRTRSRAAMASSAKGHRGVRRESAAAASATATTPRCALITPGSFTSALSAIPWSSLELQPQSRSGRQTPAVQGRGCRAPVRTCRRAGVLAGAGGGHVGAGVDQPVAEGGRAGGSGAGGGRPGRPGAAPLDRRCPPPRTVHLLPYASTPPRALQTSTRAAPRLPPWPPRCAVLRGARQGPRPGATGRATEAVSTGTEGAAKGAGGSAGTVEG